MSWLKIDDSFEDHPKVAVLSDAAHRLWMRCACWCRKRENLRTEGMVPDAMVPIIARMPKGKRLDKLVNELIVSQAGPHLSGLWERVEGGYRFHDWSDYQGGNGGESEAPPSSSSPKALAGRIGGQRSAESRRSRNGTAQPLPKQATEADRSKLPKQATEADRSKLPKQATEAAEAPDPVPDPDPDPLVEEKIQDFSGSSREDAPPSSFDSDRETLMSPDFKLHPASVEYASKHYKFPPEAIRAAVEEFKTYWVIGGGSGQRRRNWQARCLQDLKRKAESGELSRIAEKTRGRTDADRRRHERLLEATERKATAEAEARRKRLLGPQGVTKGPVPKDVQGAILTLVRGIG